MILQPTPFLLRNVRNLVNSQYDDGIDHFAYSQPGFEFHVAKSPGGILTPVNQNSEFYPAADNQLPPEIWVFDWKSIQQSNDFTFIMLQCSFYYAKAEIRDQTFMSWGTISEAMRKFTNMRRTKGSGVEIEPKATWSKDSMVIPSTNVPAVRIDFTMNVNLSCCL